MRRSPSCQQPSSRLLHAEKRIEELGIELPPPSQPKANYDICCWVKDGSMLYMSGHLPTKLDGTLITGKIGPSQDGGKSVEHGYEAARTVAMALISTLKEQLGDLDRVEQIVKVSLYYHVRMMMVRFIYLYELFSLPS